MKGKFRTNLGSGATVWTDRDGVIYLADVPSHNCWTADILLAPAEMDALVKWWSKHRAEATKDYSASLQVPAVKKRVQRAGRTLGRILKETK